jgi:hypothetical protein
MKHGCGSPSTVGESAADHHAIAGAVIGRDYSLVAEPEVDGQVFERHGSHRAIDDFGSRTACEAERE